MRRILQIATILTAMAPLAANASNLSTFAPTGDTAGVYGPGTTNKYYAVGTPGLPGYAVPQVTPQPLPYPQPIPGYPPVLPAPVPTPQPIPQPIPQPVPIPGCPNLNEQAAQLSYSLAPYGIQVGRTATGILIRANNNITFDTAQATIRPQFTAPLSAIAQSLSAYPGSSVTISGHTDSRGGDRYNLVLSAQRVNAVSRFLQRSGLSGSRIRAVAMGERQPIASNATPTGQAQNRRVELQIAPLQSNCRF